MNVQRIRLKWRLEGWQPDPPGLHNRVHVFVGGDMAPASSPNDPVFFLNHCNVDRLWAAWQNKNPNAPYLPGKNAPASPKFHRPGDRLFSVFSKGERHARCRGCLHVRYARGCAVSGQAAAAPRRNAGACYAGSRPYLGSGLLGSPENRYNLPTSKFIRGNPGL
jgi:Common central domain of tyrosinase